MDFLVSLEPEQLLQLLIGTIGCAVVLAVLIFGYLFFAWRRARKAEVSAEDGSDIAVGVTDASLGLEDRLAAVSGSPGPIAMAEHASDQGQPVDVDARLSGVGRNAWQYGLDESAKERLPLPGDEILRLLLGDDGSWWVEIAGDRYRSWIDIRDRVLSENVLRAITQCLRFSKGLVMTGGGIRSVALPVCDTVPVPTALGGTSSISAHMQALRLRSDSRSGDFWIEMGDQCFGTLVEVRDKETGERILAGISRLLQFSQGRLASDDGVGRVAVPDLSGYMERTSVQIPQEAVSVPQDDDTERRLAQERFIREMLEENTRLAQERAAAAVPSSRQEVSPVTSRSQEPTSLNLVAEIDRILQAKLAASAMDSVDAEILAGPEGGVRIRVGTQHYSTPDDVPDEELRRMIKSAIAEW
jgi:hypothetical protein